MVREIIQIQIGGCGNAMGLEFWQGLSDEHKLDGSGKFYGNIKENEEDAKRLDKIDVYFNERNENTYVARGIAIDLEPGSMDVIKDSGVAQLLKPDNYVFANSGRVSGNYASAHYSEGAELIDDVIDVVRREAEIADCMQGIQMTHSLGGGVGSGMGTLVLMKFRDNYPHKMSASYSVFPRKGDSDVETEPYNVTLSTYQLLENTDLTMVLDNQSLYNICGNVLKINKPEHSQLNWIIALAMSGITSTLRFNGDLNGDLRKLGVNLVPFPKLHFLGVCQAPLLAPLSANENDINKIHSKLTVSELTEQMLADRLLLASFEYQDGKFLSGSSIYRGENENSLPMENIDESSLRDDGVTWIPDHFKTNAIYVPAMSKYDAPISGTFLSNNTAMKTVFNRISAQFGKLYKRKAFLHWYKGEGMDEMEFAQADKSVKDLVTEFQDKEDAVVDDEYDYDYDEDEDEDDDDDGMYADEINSIDGNDDNKDNNDVNN